MDGTFTCRYCLIAHEHAERSAEHIVPDAISVEDFLLEPVCRARNSYFARAFESTVIGSSLVRFLREVFDSSRNGIYVGRAHRSDGKSYRRHLEQGQFVLRAERRNATVRDFPIRIGESLVPLRLPFDIVVGVDGSSDNIDRRRLERDVQNTKARVLDYLRELKADPSIDPEFCSRVAALGYTVADLCEPSVLVEETAFTTTSGATVVTDASPAEAEISNEALSFFFGKIAWAYSCYVLGDAAMHRGIGRKLFQLLCSAHASFEGPETARTALSLDLVRMEASKSARERKDAPLFWVDDLPKSREVVRHAGVDDDVRPRLFEALALREDVWRDLTNLVRIWPLPTDDSTEMIAQRPRRHDLHLQPSGTVAISLFGGVLTGEVDVTADVPTVERRKAIAF